MKILAVDDDQIALDILHTALIGANYDDVTSADTAEMALEKIHSEAVPFECILLDIRMPGMNGIELCQIIRDLPNYRIVPIIMITALTDKENIDAAMSAGATDYVTKPFNGLELGARLRSASTFASMLRINQKEVERAESLKNQLEKFHVHSLAAPIALNCGKGVVTDLQLENDFLKLPEGVYGLELVAISVSNIEEIYQLLSPIGFRGFLNEVATRALSTVGSSAARLAYFGSGTFVITVPKIRGVRSQKENIRSGVADKGYAELDGSGIRPIFVLAKPKHSDYWSGTAAAKGVNDVIGIVRNKCSEQHDLSKLVDFHNSLKEEDMQSSKKRFANSLLATMSQKSRVTPRRITRTD